MGDVRIERHDGPAAAALEDEVSATYGAVFAEPPYGKTASEVAANGRRFRRQCRKASFRLAVAREDGGRALGIAYGYALSADTGWWDTLTEPVPDEVRREDGHRTFGLIELAVLAEARGRGVGRDLHEAVLRDAEHERVLLNARPDADAAQTLYRNLGYRRVGGAHPWEGAVLHDVLVLELRKT
ncbi:GNAT family N-acetyltransferase [Embleya sp. NBC_00896]|uniref:GNAT family N-acetyltransferase n=1 Tax=Embleya sp. NBC_00896 TaxID=2975961 RepID=UPI002F915872|nr:GNAT family N-acetyltransferase [Embleya sp. NBC_00896]